MIHYTSKAYLVSSKINGRNGKYGATTSIIGVFNTEKRAETAKKEFLEEWAKTANSLSKINERDITITTITPNVIDEQILSNVYE